MIKIVYCTLVALFGARICPIWALIPLICLVWYVWPSENDPKRTWVLVLGDLGHSPRIMNQALSLIKNGQKVTMFGYCESGLSKESRKVVESGDLKIVPLSTTKLDFLPPGPIRYIIKTCIQTIYLLAVFSVRLLGTERPCILLLQNPPSIPTLFVAWLVSTLNDIYLAVDWHNYGYSIMKIQKQNSTLVNIAEVYEKFFAQLSHVNFTVTQRMAEELKLLGAEKVSVLYDKPHSRFRRLDAEEKSALFSRLVGEIPELAKVKKGAKLLMSSTSWTKDEDFGILLEALVELEGKLTNDLVVIITGKGPEKSFYNKKIGELGLKRISIVTPWLEADDYPLLLGCADLGVSLHSSSSGVDLPMKVVDMFGAGLPVLALDFPAIGELVENQKNGNTFKSAAELSQQLESYLINDGGSKKLEDYRKYLLENRVSWDDHWNEVALPQLV